MAVGERPLLAFAHADPADNEPSRSIGRPGRFDSRGRPILFMRPVWITSTSGTCPLHDPDCSRGRPLELSLGSARVDSN